jgi:hypothetical protein
MSYIEGVTIRYAFPDDARALARLAVLDSQEPSDGWLLVAEVGAELRAALARDGRAIADPFHPSADLVQLLRERARQLSAADRTRDLRRLRPWRSRAAATGT